jgi:CPA2 family monovalent cation:H+ antiporter-2
MHDSPPLITTIAAGFTAAWVLGLFTQWLRLSPIVGYLLAGVLIGPHTPGFIGDVALAQQLAEIGVILLMFGVGLHFHLDDLLAVKSIAIPGAIGQSLVATLLAIPVFAYFGLEPMAGAVIGMAMAVASTVVLMRVLMDGNVLSSPQGHVAVGWLLVEDVLTVIVLVLMPVMATEPTLPGAEQSIWSNPLVAVGLALAKLALLVAIVMFAGARVVPWALVKVARLRSRELFTLTVMVFSVAIAAGAYWLFGASMALGAFLAGMVVAQSPVSHQAAADALPLRDAFAVLFFVSVGMLFDPRFLIEQPLMMLAALAIILIAKPLSALLIVAALGHSTRTALTVALGLAQIGEFSFILSDLAGKLGLMPSEGHSLLVGAAILSITVNPLLFRSVDSVENWLKRRPRLWQLLNSRGQRRASQTNLETAARLADEAQGRLAVVIGFGPVGRSVERLLSDAGLKTVVIDMNMDTVSELRRQGRTAIFGDASREAILELAGVEQAAYLVMTLPQSNDRAAIVSNARNLNPKLRIFVRARYLREREELEQVGATAAVFEEAEAAVALARLVLADTGASRELIERTVRDIRLRLILENVSNLSTQPVRNIMIPWTRVWRLSSSATLDEVRAHVGEGHHSRWPVVDAKSGAPLGYLLAKDLVVFTANGESWTTLIRPLSAVSPEDPIEAILQHFQQEATTVCLVQEGDSPLGLVTIEDVLEQVVGRIEDEYPRRPKVYLRDVLWSDDALLELASVEAEPAIAEIVAQIPSDRLPAGADVAELAIERERELPTSVGFGVAIPHARCPRLAAPLVVFARSTDGVVFDRSLTEPVHLIFLLITPVEQPDVQVLLLSQLAGAAGNPDVRRRLTEANTAAEVHAILSEQAPAEQAPTESVPAE